MKKLMLFFAIASGLNGLSYGMDFDVANCDRLVQERQWGLLRSLMRDYPIYRDMLLQKDIQDLNKFDQYGGSLFEVLFAAYVIAKNATQRLDYESKVSFWKNLLEALILKGLDFKVKRNDVHVYKSYGNRGRVFWQLFDDIVRKYPDQKDCLCNGFESEIAARTAKQQKKASKVAFKAAQKIRDEKLTKGITYLYIGCVAVVVISCGYKLYMKYVADNEQEKDEEENQKTQQEANAEQVTNA